MPPLAKENPKAPNKPDDKIPFIIENLESLPNLLGPRKAPTIANFNNLKMAFRPFGQSDKNPLSARKQAEWKQQLKSFKTSVAGAETWPHEVPSFELWAAATSYKPSEADGGPQFQRMMQHLLVGNGAATPKFNANGYYNKKRSDGWYKYQPSYGKSFSYKDGPHHLGLDKGAYHTAATQGAWLGGDKGDGGATGMGNNNSEPRQFISPETKIGKFDIAVPIKPASKTNWLYHCLGIGVDKQDGDAAGFNNSANSFVTDGTKSNCAEASGGCVALGNTLAAFIGLYYYPECNQADNNWVVTQARNSHTYNVRMRMWNPRYELQDTTYENSGVEVPTRRLLVRELKNALAIITR